MKYGLLILSFLGGFFGLLLDGYIFDGSLVFTYALFFAPSIYLLGDLYSKLTEQKEKETELN